MRIVEWAPAHAPAQPPPFGAAFEAHLAAYRNQTARESSAAAWALLYRVLQTNALPVKDVVFGAHGKPYFAGNEVFFSLSHADGLVAVSVADVPTGVDIERRDRSFNPRLVEKCLTEREKQCFDGDFIRLWCRKESIVKLTGEGLFGYPVNVETADSRFDFSEASVTHHGEMYHLVASFARETPESL